MNFLMLRNSSAFLVLDYEEVVFGSFNSGCKSLNTTLVGILNRIIFTQKNCNVMNICTFLIHLYYLVNFIE